MFRMLFSTFTSSNVQNSLIALLCLFVSLLSSFVMSYETKASLTLKYFFHILSSCFCFKVTGHFSISGFHSRGRVSNTCNVFLLKIPDIISIYSSSMHSILLLFVFFSSLIYFHAFHIIIFLYLISFFLIFSCLFQCFQNNKSNRKPAHFAPSIVFKNVSACHTLYNSCFF